MGLVPSKANVILRPDVGGKSDGTTMGYSCRADAMETLERMMGTSTSHTSTGWLYNGWYCFYEIGRENRDGAITGKVHMTDQPSDIFERAAVIKSGSFRISPDGKVERFPYATQAMLKAALR